ncbi:MAG: hypothetical protein JW839_03595 [Candidatus Lokiarchaeota archaeon]|nr:hypothetical protein [Candidatus Lokiarchaeota archaeon]
MMQRRTQLAPVRHADKASTVLKLLKIVTKRVANRKIHEIFDGTPRTDGFNVWLPISSPAFSFDEKVGIASHEAAHIRFRTILGTSIPELVCPENHRIGHAVLNILEDARIETLLKEIYFGFWIDLDKANVRQIQANLLRFSADGKEILHSQRTVDLCLHLISAHSLGHAELLYSDAMRTPGGCFRFSAEALGTFWRSYLEAHEYLVGQLTFPATVVAAKQVIKALKALLGDLDSKQREGAPDEHSDREKVQHSRGLQDQALPANIGGPTDGSVPVPEQAAAPGAPAGREGAEERVERSPGAEPGAPGSRSNAGPGKRGRNRALADQVLSMNHLDSGISIGDAEKQDRKVMNELKKRLNAAGDDAEKLRKSLKSLAKKEAVRLKRIVKEHQEHDAGPGDGCDEHVTVKDDEEGDEVNVDAIEDIVRLREFNNIEDPTREYMAIARENGYTIKQLRKALERIKINPLVQRGARRGIICDRDLPRVVSSKGKFNRPFVATDEKRGASLLIVIDESASMSVDDGIKSFMREDDDCCCPRSEACRVRSGCPDREYCEWSGTWPKGYLVECDRLDDCPMKESLAASDDADASGDCTKKLPIYVAKKSAIVLAEALKETRIDFGVIGFSAVGGKNVIVEKVYKRLDEEVNPRKLGSIWVSFESGENRDGTSFQAIASRHLKASQKRLPVMIIISDGEPHHGGTEYVGQVAENMTARAIQALKQKVKLFAISIDQRGRNYLKDIYGTDNYIVLNDPKDITNKLIYLVKSIAAALC